MRKIVSCALAWDATELRKDTDAYLLLLCNRCYVSMSWLVDVVVGTVTVLQ